MLHGEGQVKEDRKLQAFWLPEKNKIQGVLLSAHAHDPNTGYLTLQYQFEGFAEYMKEKQKKQGSVF